MQAIGRGGVHGKARVVRARRRSERQYAERMIDEYLHPARPQTHQKRPIPIGRRRDFLPSVEYVGGIPTGGAGDLHRSPGGPESASERTASPRRNPAAACRAGSTSAFGGSSGDTLSATRAGRASGTFSLAGFLAGCAVGSAAAALALLALQTVFAT